MCQNIDDFNRACALVFADLYSVFPAPATLAVRDLCDRMGLEKEAPHERLDRMALVSATIGFLIDEGYVRAGDRHGAFVQDAVLTAKGLAALNRVPSAIRPAGKTIGDTLIDLTKGLALDSAKDAARAAVQAVLGP